MTRRKPFFFSSVSAIRREEDLSIKTSKLNFFCPYRQGSRRSKVFDDFGPNTFVKIVNATCRFFFFLWFALQTESSLELSKTSFPQLQNTQRRPFAVVYTINDHRSLLIILYYINAVEPVKRVLETCWKVLSTDSLGQHHRTTTTTLVFNKIIITQNTCVVVQLLLLSLCILCALVLIAAIKHHCVLLLLLFSKNHYGTIVCVCVCVRVRPATCLKRK